MRMAAEQRIAASRQRVWEALNDPQVLRASLPGCQSLEQEAADRFSATLEVRVGPIGARFKGLVSLENLDPPNGYTLNLEGNGGIAGSAKGSATVRLREEADATVVAYDIAAEVGGRMAQLGGPIIDATARQMAGKFFGRFSEIVGAASPVGADAAGVAPPAATAVGGARTGAAAGGSPMAWILATALAAFAGFSIGRASGGLGADWSGLAVGLVVIGIAGAAFEYGRRTAGKP